MTYQSIKILVTGASGKVGSRLIPRLIQWGYSVKASVRNPESFSKSQSSDLEFVLGDLQNHESLKTAMKDVNVVIHLATFYPSELENDFKRVNVESSQFLAKIAIEAGVQQFIFASSNRVYGTDRGKLVTEDDVTKPEGNKFAEVKVETENALLRQFKNKNAALCILRLSLVYGDDDPHVKQTLQELKTWAPAKRIQMVHHADIAQAVKLSISQKANGIFNLTDDAPLSVSELRELYNIPDTSNELISDPWEMMVSNFKIRRQLGYKPIYPTFYSAYDAGAL